MEQVPIQGPQWLWDWVKEKVGMIDWHALAQNIQHDAQHLAHLMMDLFNVMWANVDWLIFWIPWQVGGPGHMLALLSLLPVVVGGISSIVHQSIFGGAIVIVYMVVVIILHSLVTLMIRLKHVAAAQMHDSIIKLKLATIYHRDPFGQLVRLFTCLLICALCALLFGAYFSAGYHAVGRLLY
jgi:hypothetical protein